MEILAPLRHSTAVLAGGGPMARAAFLPGMRDDMDDGILLWTRHGLPHAGQRVIG